MVEPFLRWAGGKRWLAPHITDLINKSLNSKSGRYIEPFLGSGAIYFRLAPPRAILTDTNQSLIETYLEVQKNWLPVHEQVMSLPVSKEFYYSVRESKPGGSVQRAARFIYLNRTCYGGIYRENKNGMFNVPYGGGSRTTAPLLQKQLLKKAHKLLASSASVMHKDFEVALESATNGDVVYCDPTYSTPGRDHFDRYGSKVFSWDDQIRLARKANEAYQRGAVVVISNTAFEEIKSLYPNANCLLLENNTSIAKKTPSKKNKTEYLFILDPHDSDHWYDFAGKQQCSLALKHNTKFAISE